MINQYFIFLEKILGKDKSKLTRLTQNEILCYNQYTKEYWVNDEDSLGFSGIPIVKEGTGL